MKPIFKILLLLFLFLRMFLNSYAQEGCSVDMGRGKTLTEFLFQNNKATIFSCKVKSSIVILSSGEASSVVEIQEVYFGKTNLKEVKIITGSFPPSGLPELIAKPIIKKEIPNPVFLPGSQEGEWDIAIIDGEGGFGRSRSSGFKMKVGDTYLIYGNDTARIQNYNSTYSKELKETPQIKNEIVLLKTFDRIFKRKESGYFKFKNHKGYILAEGAYKKGKATDVWKHYDANGRIVIELDLKTNKTVEYSDNGCIMSITTKHNDTTAYEYYVNNEQNKIRYKSIEIKNDIQSIYINSTYDKNGNITEKKSELSIYNKTGNSFSGMGYHGSCQEYYSNGKVKLNAQYLLNRRVGCWTWYNEDGTFWAEWDYTDGKAPQ